jgi:hypothetical protein
MDGKYQWYGKPTREDIKAIRKTVSEWIDLWVCDKHEENGGMTKERLIDIAREFYGDMRLAEPDEEIRETIQGLKITTKEIEELGIAVPLEYLE